MNENEKYNDIKNHHPTQSPENNAAGGEMPEKKGIDREDVGHKALSDALSVSFKFLKIGMLILLVIYLMQGWFYVPRDRVAIKLSFGRPVEVKLGPGRGSGYVMDSESGWHFAWPWQEIVWLPLEQQTLDIDREFTRGGGMEGEQQRRAEEGQLSLYRDNYLITGDVNLIHMSLRARYRVRSDQTGAFDYAFRFDSPEEVFRRIIIQAVIEVVSNWEVLEVRRKRREKEISTEEGPRYMRLSLFEEIDNRIINYMRAFEENNGFSIGIELVGIEPIRDPEVPDEIKPHFDMALDAESRKDALIQEARRQATSIEQDAYGDRAEIIGRAEAYKTRVVTSADADAEMLQKLLGIYQRSPKHAAILKEWHYGRMVDELLGLAEGSFVLHGESETVGRELWLELSPQHPRKNDDEDE